MATIDRGEDYIYDDFIDNIVSILTTNQTALGLAFIGTFNDFLVSKYPSVYVVFDTALEEWVTMPNVKNIKMTAVIHYYHRAIDQEVRKDQIDEMLGKLAKIIRKNHSCNGFLNTPDGFTVECIEAMGDLRGELGGVGDGIIMVSGVKRIRVLNIV